MGMTYVVFKRAWWRREGSSLVPNSRGRKTTIQRDVRTEADAQAICRRWNANHNPGPLSIKAEYTED